MRIAKGINVRFDKKKAERGERPWVVFVETIIGGREIRKAPCFEHEADALKEALVFVASLAKMRADHAAEEARRRGPVALPMAGTFEEYATTWLKAKMKLKPSTRASYEQLLRLHVYPVIGADVFDKTTFDTTVIDRLIAHHAEAGMRTGTLKSVVRVVSSCCNYARRRNVLVYNPAADMCRDIGRPDDEPVEPNPLSEEHTERFLTWVYTNERWWYPYFLCLFRTGMRVGEAAGFRLDCYSPKTFEGYLKWSYSHRAKKDQQTKSWRGRPIELSPQLVEAIDEHVAEVRKLLLKHGTPAATHVFYTPRGVRALPDSERPVWDRAITALKLTHVGHTPHDARDTFATTHLQKGSDRLTWVSMMLGHRHTSTTLNRYTRWTKTVASEGYAASLDRVDADRKMGAESE
jgi:integrase